MCTINFPRRVLLACALSFPMTSVFADVLEDLELHGFVTQGFVKTSANRFFGDSEDGSLDFREIGLNAAFQPLDDLRLSGQILSRKAGDMYSASPAIDFAVADFTLASAPSHSLNLLIGRVKNPIGLFNDTRDVAFTRPGVFLPQTVYFDKVRNLFLSADGIGLRSAWFGESVNTAAHVVVGWPLVDENVEHAYLGTNHSGELSADELALSGRLQISTVDDRWRLAASLASVSMGFEPASGSLLTKGNVRFEYWLASIQYTGAVFALTAEYMREPIDWTGFSGSVFSGFQTVGESYYVQVAGQFFDTLTPTIRYEEGVFDRSDPSGARVSQRTLSLVPASAGFSKIWTAGVRWDWSDDWALMAEYQWHNGTHILSTRENAGQPVREDWELFAVTLSYRF